MIYWQVETSWVEQGGKVQPTTIQENDTLTELGLEMVESDEYR
jgi:hypothetical protein